MQRLFHHPIGAMMKSSCTSRVDTFEILTAGTVNGSFTDTTFPTLDPPLFWQLNQDSDSIELVIFEAGWATSTVTAWSASKTC